MRIQVISLYFAISKIYNFFIFKMFIDVDLINGSAVRVQKNKILQHCKSITISYTCLTSYILQICDYTLKLNQELHDKLIELVLSGSIHFPHKKK